MYGTTCESTAGSYSFWNDFGADAMWQLAMAEIYKIIPELLHRFKINMPQEREWSAFNASFSLTNGVVCDLERRDV